MLISKAPDEDEDKAEECTLAAVDDSHEYQTASELFEFMAKNQNFSSNDGSTLTPRDLVLLYKNIDISAKLISNRRVETVVYGDDPESDCSDISEVYSNEDLKNIILINKEQIDFLNSPSSVENKLCQKFGDLELQTSISTAYDKHFLFKDTYIKEQIKGFNLLSDNNEMEASVLPASLLDYVCCKRLEDNYNFYMDNIIRYVKNTIDQLKRISNGDYLTDKVKEKWREVEHAEDTSHDNTKVLATSTSIPLHVECKSGGLKSTWDEIVHSAVDVRSLSKILEKKIIVEIPKLINGSYTLLSKCSADNLIISCKKDYQQVEDYKKSRVDVVLQLKRSETGHVVSKISSFMILQSAPPIQEHQTVAPKVIEKAANDGHESGVKVVELDTSIQEIDEVQDTSVIDDDVECFEDSDSLDFQTTLCNTFYSSSQDDTTESTSTFNTNLDRVKRHVQKEASFHVCPDDLRMTIQRLATQSALPEESIEDVSQSTVTKKKSPMRIRIKSPYENKSHILEEKKRKKLLEIRERREMKKMALAENCKITKHRYGKGAIMPQASSSVTKLSITNKSFYNSIYGRVDTKVDIKETNNKSRKKDEPREVFQEALENLEIPQEKHELSPANTKKFINRSYYLDETVSEMMYMKMKRQEKDITSGSTSGVSSDFRSNFNMLSPLSCPLECDLNKLDEKSHPPATPKHLLFGPSDCEGQGSHSREIAASQSTLNIVPANTPKPATRTENEKNDNKKVTPSVECRKSIDKIYQLVKKLGKNQSSRSKPQRIFSTNTSNAVNGSVDRGPFLVQESDSSTSLRLITSPSYPAAASSFSYSKKNSTEASMIYDKKPASPTTVTKVIISSKSQIPIPKNEILKTDIPKTKDYKRSGVNFANKALDINPLHAISQFLHEFDNVQKKRIKSGTEQKPARKSDASNDGKNMSRQDTYKKRSRFEQHSDFIDKYASRATTSKDKRIRTIAGSDGLKIPYQQGPADDKTTDKSGKKKIMEILDEAKEARGEAVRGPSKFTSRLNSLAQPKRTYVQAHSEEYQTRYGRNLITDRLQRLASAPSPLVTERGARIANSRNKIKRSSNEADYNMSLKQPIPMGFPIERSARPKRPRNNSPILKERVTTGGGSIYTHMPVENPEALKKKMVAVKSYVKDHYGLDSRISQKSRTLLIPNDINIALAPSSTLLKSSEVGNDLHRIIESIMGTTSHGLDVVTEFLETNSRTSRAHSDDVFYSPMCDEEISIASDYTSDSDDSHLMNVDTKKQRRTNIGQTDCKHAPMQPYQSATMLKNLALNSHLSLGTFSKHLKINNIAVTPKSSIQKLFLLQSGDAGSLLVKTLSSASHTEKLKCMPTLSNTQWNLRFPNIPMHITTVGYAFPEYNSALPSPKQLLEDLTKSSHKATFICHNGVNKSLSVDGTYANHKRCKNKKLHARFEEAAQGDLMNFEAESRSNEKQEQASFIQNNNTFKSISIQAITDYEEIKTNTKETKITQTVTFEEKCTSDITTNKPAEVEYTKSLDILVGLLNEIQKITTCQTHITNNETEECKELKMLINKAAALDNSIESPYNNVSITSLDKLRCLDSNPSLYSFYISDGGQPNRNINIRPNIDPWYETKNNAYHTKIYVDKEVNVHIIDKECVNTLTDVPSVFFPITNTSTNMTNTLVEEFCQSSIQSLLTFTDYHGTYSNALFVQSTHCDDSSKKIIELLPEIKNTPQDANQYSEDHQQVKEISKAKLVIKRQARSLIKDASIKSNVMVPRNNYCLKNSDFDPVMKLKRDILVTVYSMLVLTVFAALSFPEVLYHVM